MRRISRSSCEFVFRVLCELEMLSGDTKDKASDAELLVVTYEMRAQYTYILDR